MNVISTAYPTLSQSNYPIDKDRMMYDQNEIQMVAFQPEITK